MVFPYCGFISNKDQTQFSFPGAAPGRITQQMKVSVMANTVLLPASAVVSPDAFFFFFFSDCTANAFWGASLQVFLDYFGSYCAKHVAPPEEHPSPALASILLQ